MRTVVNKFNRAEWGGETYVDGEKISLSLYKKLSEGNYSEINLDLSVFDAEDLREELSKALRKLRQQRK